MGQVDGAGGHNRAPMALLADHAEVYTPTVFGSIMSFSPSCVKHAD